MTKSMLHEFYFGNIRPWERRHIHTPEYRALAEKVDDVENYFENLLPPEEFKKFREMQDTQIQINAIDELELFEYAFCTGVLLMIDIFGYQGK